MKKISRENIVRLIGIPLVAVVMGSLHKGGIQNLNIYNYWVSFIFTAIFWNGAAYIVFVFRKKYPNVRDTSLRITMTLLALILFVASVDIISYPLYLTYPNLGRNLNSFSEALICIPQDMIPVLVVSFIYETFYFFDRWKKSAIEAETLKTQQLKSELHVLKNQISPHFLFNSLNTLITLINEDQKAATQFTEKLSEVYRYILQNKDKELVHLRTEINFVHNFIFLLKMRFGNNLNIDFEVGDKYHRYYIAPLTLQMLIENAVKHNIVSVAQPLHVQIYIENDSSLVVKNNLQPKNMVVHSTKTGLENIKRRYQLLSNRSIDIITTTSNFMVALPLIKLEGELKEMAVA